MAHPRERPQKSKKTKPGFPSEKMSFYGCLQPDALLRGYCDLLPLLIWNSPFQMVKKKPWFLPTVIYLIHCLLHSRLQI